MIRQRAAQLRISPLYLQQGLFTVLALVITLLGGQQFMLWQHSQQPDAAIPATHHFTQTHFSAVSSQAAEAAAVRMLDVDQAQSDFDVPRQERWIF